MSALVHSQHKAICNRIVAVLKAMPMLAEGQVVANRKRPMPLGVERMIFVYFEESQATRGAIKGAPFDWRTRIRVECVARDVPGTLAEDAADAMGVDVYARVLADTTLAGTVLDVEPLATALTADEADTGLAAYQLLFSVWHTSAEGSISAP